MTSITEKTPEYDIFESLERQNEFYRDNPIAEGEPPLSERERQELLLRKLEEIR